MIYNVCSILHCKFVYVYLRLVLHPTVFMTHLWIHGVCVCVCVGGEWGNEIEIERD